MVELNISEKEANQRLNKFLIKYLNQAPSSFIYKMLRKKNITLNEKKAKGDEILVKGDIVKLFLSQDTIDSFKKESAIANKMDIINNIDVSNLNILYCDNDILAVHKPAGVLSQKATDNDISINEMILSYCVQNGLSDTSMGFKPSVANRLDRNTTGIILAGISLKGSQRLAKILKNRDGEKYYFTLVKGKYTKKPRQVAYIEKSSKNNVSTVISIEDYKKSTDLNLKSYDYIETEFTPIHFNGTYTLLKIKLITGKSHQIRAHLKYLGYPVVGDNKYGNVATNRYFRDNYKLKHHLLHSGIFVYEDLYIKDDLPDIFKNICKKENLDISKLFD